ncbi:hypothetical protein CON39_12040 [Bacillus thuringiensis]|uniref:hypothetical protein n=1 Tax=Bacillus thuringiensis TaxID=1428 RepID=UPI000BEB9F14|nr:hypothetical protein [Bacillus thuringiensis]PEF30394.1 hypothetical protein CON39_12040 [Bacillus thuringiensis]
MAKDKIEVRAYTDGLRWEDTPAKVINVQGKTYEEMRSNAYNIAKEISEAEQNEIRYNFVGREQGHYVGSMYKLNRLG